MNRNEQGKGTCQGRGQGRGIQAVIEIEGFGQQKDKERNSGLYILNKAAVSFLYLNVSHKNLTMYCIIY